MMPRVVEETCLKLRNWLSEEGLYKDKVYDEKLYFHLVAEYPMGSGRHVNIIQQNNRDDTVVVFSRIRLADTHEKALHALTKKEKDRFLWDMRYALLGRDANFDMEPNAQELQSIQFSREVYYDGLTKDKIMEIMRDNFKCELYVIWKFQEAFGSEIQDKQAEHMLYC